MTDYSELVKALRSASTVSTAWEKLMHDAAAAIEALQAELSKRDDGCDVCRNGNLEEGDTLYKSSDWDGGIGFDYIRDIRFCPICGRKLEVQE